MWWVVLEAIVDLVRLVTDVYVRYRFGISCLINHRAKNTVIAKERA
jgi:hypothetical protein